MKFGGFWFGVAACQIDGVIDVWVVDKHEKRKKNKKIKK